MADFIAVIRRAVDGLSENTPEMRMKVYDRAKSAVVRQLENMKPRPPEVMFQRQLDKLDAAIREVESEHTEALPADDVPADFKEAAPAAVVAEPAIQEPASQEPEAIVEPAPASVAQPAEVFAEPIEQPQPAIPPYVTAETPFTEPEAHLEAETHPAQLAVAPYEAKPEIQHAEEIAAAEPEAAKAPDEEPIEETAPETVYQPFVEPAEDEAEPAPDQARTATEDSAAVQPAGQWAVDIDREPETFVEEPVEDEAAAPMPKVSYDESDVVAGFNDFVKEEMNRQVVPPPPVRKSDKQNDFSWDAPFDDLPEIKKPETFEKALEAKQKELAASQDKRALKPEQVEPLSARAELEDLIGIEPGQRRSPPSANDDGGLAAEIGRGGSKLEGKSFKMQKKNKKKKRAARMTTIGIGVAGVLVIAGAAYGLWHYRDNVSQLVAGSGPAQETTKPADTKSSDVKSDADTPAVDTDVAKTPDTTKNTEVASLSTETGPQKFTQRLMPDGSEADTEAARVPVDQALLEGKSVAGQTEKSKEVADTTATDAKPEATTDIAKPQADAQPLGATQKMFLYEERLGQSSPVAVPGTIVWREKANGEDGKPDPTIEAQLDIPGRKITALLSIKRNTDASLPASHIIEIVFALPKDFEEGNVDSIQRVAFKQTEQDRGNPLIAVPAKITDDFHMIALNDDADARKVNLELMKTRSWIDIPITYRNGRRALITLEKGATGTAVFNKVMAEWDALGQQTNAQ